MDPRELEDRKYKLRECKQLLDDAAEQALYAFDQPLHDAIDRVSELAQKSLDANREAIDSAEQRESDGYRADRAEAEREYRAGQ